MKVIYWLLFAVYAANYLDRQIFSVLLEAIRLELELGDLEMGLLSGLTFSVAFGLASIPAALAAATGNRRNIIAASATFWGLVTVASAFASSFLHLFLARAAIAAAEAASIPASHSILSDSTSAAGRVRLFGQFVSGSALGGLMALVVGGVVGHLYGWRVAMICAGILGIIPGILMFLVKEPLRDYRSDSAGSASLLWGALGKIWKEKRSRLVFSAEIINQIVLSGAVAWYPAFLMRKHGFSQIEAAATTSFGALLAIAGTIVSSRLIGSLARKDWNWLARGPAILLFVAKPFSLLFLLADQPALALAAFAVPASLALSSYPPTISLLHEIVDPPERPIASAALMALATVVGLGLGPTLVGAVSVAIGGAASLDFALVCLQGFGVIAAALYWRASCIVSADANES